LSARDLNLKLVEDGSITATGNSATTKDTEGGFLAWVTLLLGAISGTSITWDIYVQASPDGGSTYYMIGKFQQIDESDDELFLRIPVYVPRPESGQTVTTCRLKYTLAGGASTMVVTDVFLEPMVSLAVPAGDDDRETGAAIQLSAT